MANVSDFRSYVRLSIPSAANAVIDHSLIRAARTFCKRSKAIREDLDPVDTAANTAVYTLTPPADHEVEDIAQVLYDGRELRPISHKDAAKQDPEYRTTNGVPSRYIYEGANQIRLIGVPTSVLVDAIEVRAILKPTLTATTFHDELLDDHYQAVADGALGVLFLMAGQAWHNPPLAGHHTALADNAADDARVRVSMSKTKGGSGRVRYGGL